MGRTLAASVSLSVFVSGRRKACRDGRLFAFYPISPVYQVGGDKHANFVGGTWLVSGVECGGITLVGWCGG
jgi:hypothetical protein